ncbi:MAG: GHKL domain-containing protein [Clostridium sp.]|nr:GHKL domain-containing protein [Clostridium sp.]MCM1209933.1 GHKL domain-containing protein [Ruminococcus sp.]
MLIQIFVVERLDNKFSFHEVTGIILNICILLSMQLLFFKVDLQKQFFVVFSFVAGREIVKHIVSVLSIAFGELQNKLLNILLEKDILNTMDRVYLWLNLSVIVLMLVDLLVYALLLFLYVFLISRTFIKKDYPLHLQENMFLILPCITALCISVTIKKLIISVENGMTIMVYDTVPAAKFWVPFICVLLFLTMIASVVLFQKLVEYNEETKKRAILENQVQQMQREISEIQDVYTDMRGLRHDMRSHLANISLLVKQEDGSANEELERYIGKMEDTVKKLDFAYQTGNPITDIIIHQKRQEIEKKQIGFDVDFTYPSKLSIDVYDIAVILNNALENAIEACCKVEEQKQIRLSSYVKGNLFFIEVENDFRDAVVIEEENGLPISSKKNKKLHGIGISNIQRCAKKYMGDIDIVITDTEKRKKFSLTVMMNGKPAAAN